MRRLTASSNIAMNIVIPLSSLLGLLTKLIFIQLFITSPLKWNHPADNVTKLHRDHLQYKISYLSLVSYLIHSVFLSVLYYNLLLHLKLRLIFSDHAYRSILLLKLIKNTSARYASIAKCSKREWPVSFLFAYLKRFSSGCAAEVRLSPDNRLRRFFQW